MKEVKDLVYLEKDLNDKPKKEIVQKDKNFKNAENATKKNDLPIDINKNTKTQNIKYQEEKKDKRSVRIFMKYEDGDIKYIKEDSDSNNSLMSKLKSFFNKEKINKETNNNSKKFFYKLLTVFLIISMIFIYFYYIKDDFSDNSNIHSQDEINNKINNETNKIDDKIDVKTNKFKKNIEQERYNKKIVDENNELSDKNNELSNEYITKNDVIDNINTNIYKLNLIEKEKIHDYIDLKANRGAIIALLKKNRSTKENLYLYLKENSQLFEGDKNSYKKTEDVIIRSIAMSEELLQSFEGSSTKNKLERILEKYN